MDNIGPKHMRAFIVLYMIVTLLTATMAIFFEAPFVLIFKHTGAMLLAILLYMGVLGIIWDGSLIITGLVFEALRRWTPYGKGVSISVESTRRIRFFTCGPWPLIMVLSTALIIYGTGNITLICLKLIGSTTEWRDPFFWGIEGPVIQSIVNLPINTTAWDMLYHSAWGIELLAAFILVLIGRDTSIIYKYCISMIFLFYIGRFLGVLNPVMGPAFFQPEVFGYLSGSVTDTAMQSVADIMAIAPDEAKNESGLLLGGVSAMPSLHLGMVTLTTIWLAIASRWTLFITIPWVLLVWTSTVVLGWHYILDGAGGIALGGICAWATQQYFLNFIERSKTRSQITPAPSS